MLILGTPLMAYLTRDWALAALERIGLDGIRSGGNVLAHGWVTVCCAGVVAYFLGFYFRKPSRREKTLLVLSIGLLTFSLAALVFSIFDRPSL